MKKTGTLVQERTLNCNLCPAKIMNKPIRKIDEKQALNRLMEICSKAEKSPAEIEKKISDWGLNSHRESLLEKLREENFINPERFALAFSRDKVKLNKWGKIKIRYALRGHLIEPDTIDHALNQIDDEIYEEMIREELKKKHKSLKNKNPFQVKSKLYAFGSQRGYESDLINRYFRSEGL